LRFHRTPAICAALLIALIGTFASGTLAQATPRTPTEVTREFYKLMREKKFREAFGLSIYRFAIDGLSQQEFDDLRPDFEKMAFAVSEAVIDVTGEQISGDSAAVFVRVPNPDGKEKVEPVPLRKVDKA